MKRLIGCALGMGLILTLGCKAVYTEKPIGGKPVAVAAGDWEGTWRHKDGTFYVKVLDADQGLIQAGWVETDDEKALKLESWTIRLRTAGNWTLGSFKENDEKDLYVWGRFRNGDDQVTFWAPDLEKFKALVAKGAFPGRVDDDGNVILGELDADQLKRIASEEEGLLLNWEEPVVFFRVAK